MFPELPTIFPELKAGAVFQENSRIRFNPPLQDVQIWSSTELLLIIVVISIGYTPKVSLLNDLR